MTDREALIVLPLAAIANEPGLKRTVRAVSPTDAGRKTKPLVARDVAMRVKLCARCPYVPQDLADHYDACASLHLCALRQRKGDFRDPART